MNRITLYEWLAGKLLVRSARLRVRRGKAGDIHELRHIWAAINAGNSDPCDGGANCTLDRNALTRFTADYPGLHGYERVSPVSVTIERRAVLPTLPPTDVAP